MMRCVPVSRGERGERACFVRSARGVRGLVAVLQQHRATFDGGRAHLDEIVARSVGDRVEAAAGEERMGHGEIAWKRVSLTSSSWSGSKRRSDNIEPRPAGHETPSRLDRSRICRNVRVRPGGLRHRVTWIGAAALRQSHSVRWFSSRMSQALATAPDGVKYRTFMCVVCAASSTARPRAGPPMASSPARAGKTCPKRGRCPDCGVTKSDFEMVEIRLTYRARRAARMDAGERSVMPDVARLRARSRHPELHYALVGIVPRPLMRFPPCAYSVPIEEMISFPITAVGLLVLYRLRRGLLQHALGRAALGVGGSR